MDTILKIVSSLCGDAEPVTGSAFLQEKSSLLGINDQRMRTTQSVATDVVDILRTAGKDDPSVAHRIKHAARAEGWTESLAQAILGQLESVMASIREKGRDGLGAGFVEALEKAENAAKECFEFSKEHPWLVAGFVTIVAVGLLVVFSPWVVEALGFGAEGPIGDSIATAWQQSYGSCVPKGSLFSYFQRLGMTWGRS